MDTADEDEIVSPRLALRVECEVDSVVYSSQVIQARSAIGITDGYEIAIPVFLVDRHDTRRRETVNRGQHRRLHQARVRQCHKVIVAVDQVELRSVLEEFRDVEVLGYLGIDRTILLIAALYHCVQVGTSNRVSGGEESYLPSPIHQALGDVSCHRLPGAILARRRPPGDR